MIKSFEKFRNKYCPKKSYKVPKIIKSKTYYFQIWFKYKVTSFLEVWNKNWEILFFMENKKMRTLNNILSII